MADQAAKQATETANNPNLSAEPQQHTNVEPGVPRELHHIGSRKMRQEFELYTDTSPILTGGDVDAAWEQAASVGEEAVGGTVATPDQSIVDELGAAVGLEMDDRQFLHTTEILDERDSRRWELDPKSSEDYEDRED